MYSHILPFRVFQHRRIKQSIISSFRCLLLLYQLLLQLLLFPSKQQQSQHQNYNYDYYYNYYYHYHKSSSSRSKKSTPAVVVVVVAARKACPQKSQLWQEKHARNSRNSRTNEKVIKNVVLFCLFVLTLKNGKESKIFFTIKISSKRSFNVAFQCEQLRQNETDTFSEDKIMYVETLFYV